MEFLKEYHHEPAGTRQRLLADAPGPTGDERWDVLLAGIEDAFRRLGERLARRGVIADLYVFGGAAMALAYDSRRATRDVDALFKPHGIVHDEARWPPSLGCPAGG
jgi:hypothetical protein